MTSTLSVPFTMVVTAEVHAIEGGGFWAEVLEFPGCVAYSQTTEELPGNIVQAIEDWRAEAHVKTEADARKLAAVQGASELPDESYPQDYSYSPPAGWTDEDE